MRASVLERTDWLEDLRQLATAGRLKASPARSGGNTAGRPTARQMREGKGL